RRQHPSTACRQTMSGPLIRQDDEICTLSRRRGGDSVTAQCAKSFILTAYLPQRTLHSLCLRGRVVEWSSTGSPAWKPSCAVSSFLEYFWGSATRKAQS